MYDGSDNAATQNGHVHLVKWLHLNRMEATSASPMTAFISERNIALVREMYDGDDPYFWPRPGDMPTLVMLVQSKDAVDQEILKTITSCRRKRYCPDGPENPEEYMLVQHGQPLYPTRDAIQHDKSFSLTLVAVVSRRWSLPRETSQLISQFVMPHPTKKLTREDAVRRVLVHWLVSFSSFPSEDMMALAEISHIDAACWMLDRLQRDGRVQCSKRLMYLTVEKGSLDIIKWHVLNCGAHDINEWLYVATWIGRVDAVEWMVGECPEINAERSIHKQLQLERQHVTQQIQDKPRKVILTRKTMFHSLDASFAEVEERFAAGLMDIEATMNDAEKSAQRGDLIYIQYVHTQDQDLSTTNLADLAAVYGHFDCVKYLLSERYLSCTVSGLYGAITRGHFSVVKRIYQYQPRHSIWPREEATSVLRRLLRPSTEELRTVLRRSKNPTFEEESLDWLLKFIRNFRNMRLDSQSLNEAAYRGDLTRVELICQHDLVENKSAAADIAAARGDLAMLEVLFGAMASTGPKCTTQAFDGAAEGGHLEVVKYLHEHGAPCSRRAIDFASFNGHVDIVRYLLEHRQEGCSPYALQWASSRGHSEVVESLLALSIPVASEITTCLQVARQRGHDAVVVLLAKHVGNQKLQVSSRHQQRHKWQQIEMTHVSLPHGGLVVEALRQRLDL